MAPNQRIPHAIIVLPAGLHGRTRRAAQRRWLAAGRVAVRDQAEETLDRVLRAIGQPVLQEGQAALRFWGQTGERPGGWIAAADPVHLEARQDHLCLHSLAGDAITIAEFSALIDHLQATLGCDGRHTFIGRGRCGYLRGQDPITTASVSPRVLDGGRPDDYLPGDNVAHDRLLSEIQMTLHEHEVNRRLAAAGKYAVNSLWLWGAGVAPPVVARKLPVLFGDEPLLRGYWHHCDGTAREFAGNLSDCRDLAPRDFVAVTPDETHDAAKLESYLEELATLLRRREIGRLTMLFRDGLSVVLRKRDALRFWRKVPGVLQEARADV